MDRYDGKPRSKQENVVDQRLLRLQITITQTKKKLQQWVNVVSEAHGKERQRE